MISKRKSMRPAIKSVAGIRPLRSALFYLNLLDLRDFSQIVYSRI